MLRRRRNVFSRLRHSRPAMHSRHACPAVRQQALHTKASAHAPPAARRASLEGHVVHGAAHVQARCGSLLRPRRPARPAHGHGRLPGDRGPQERPRLPALGESHVSAPARTASRWARRPAMRRRGRAGRRPLSARPHERMRRRGSRLQALRPSSACRAFRTPRTRQAHGRAGAQPARTARCLRAKPRCRAQVTSSRAARLAFVSQGACPERVCSQPPDHARSVRSPEWKTGRPPLSSKARPPLANVREYCSGLASRRGQRAGKSGASTTKRAEARRGQERAFEVAAGVVPAVALPAAAAVPAGKAAHRLREAAVHRREQSRAGRRRACTSGRGCGRGRGCGCGCGRGCGHGHAGPCPSLAPCAGCCGAGRPCASPPPCVTADLEQGCRSPASGDGSGCARAAATSSASGSAASASASLCVSKPPENRERAQCCAPPKATAFHAFHAFPLLRNGVC